MTLRSDPSDAVIVHEEAFDADDAVRLRAAARIDVDALAGRHSDVGAPLVAAMMAVHLVARDRLGVPLGCGGLVAVGDGVYEIRRLFVRSTSRRVGIGTSLLRELEQQATDLGAPAITYETDLSMTGMIAFLEHHGYYRIAPWGVYATNPGSVCLARTLP